MASVGLTDAKLKAMQPPAAGQLEIADSQVPGLRIRIGTGGAKTFIVRRRVDGKQRNLTLGRYGPRFTLLDARKKARAMIGDIEAGAVAVVKPAAPQTGSGRAGTVAVLWGQYIEQAVHGKKRSAATIERYGEKYILPMIGDRLADTLTRGDVTRFVETVTHGQPDKPKPSTGRAAHAQLSAFYGWALPRLDRLPANPCRDAGRPAVEKARDRFLSEPEIAAFWTAAGKLGWPFGPAFQLLLLTGQRRCEVFDADRAEFGRDTWTIPAHRAKNGVGHLVPVSDAAWSLLDTLPAFVGTDRLFPSRGNLATSASGFSRAHERLCILMARELDVAAVEPFTLHDLRRTAATGMQRLGIAQPVVEAVLNHLSGSRGGIAGVYQRYAYGDEKRAALAAWGVEIERITGHA